MWIALDPVTDNAAMRFIAGSHQWGRWFIPRKFIDQTPYTDEGDRYEYVPDIDRLIEADPATNRVVSFSTEPGDVIVFHYRTVHDAPGNPSATKTYVVDMAGGNKRTDYVAVSNTVIGLILLLTGFIGALASVISVAGVVLVLSLLGLLGALLGRSLPEVQQ
jgi:hypothetical protein